MSEAQKEYTFNELAEATFRAREAGNKEASDWLEAEARRVLAASKPENQPASTLDKAVGSFPGRLALGVGSVPTGALQLGANIGGKLATGLSQAGLISGEQEQNLQVVPEWLNKQVAMIEAMKRRGMKARGNEGFDVAGLIGAVGAGMAGKAPEIAKTAAERIGQAGVSGAGYGAITPVTEGDYAEQKAKDIKIGALLGPAAHLGTAGVAKVAGAGFETVKNVATPWLPGGTRKLVGELANEAAGPRRDDILKALVSQKAYVPGSELTAGQAAAKAGSAEFSALQEAVKKRLPSDYDEIAQAGKAARSNLIKSGGGTELQLAADATKRKLASEPFYDAVRDSTAKVDVSPAVKRMADIFYNNKNESAITAPIKKIMLKISRKTKDGVVYEDNPRNLASLSKEIKKLMGETSDGKKTYDEVALKEIKEIIDDQIAKAEPNYLKARETYKEFSKPLNEKKIMNLLTEKMASPDKETPITLLKALTDQEKVIKEATGFPGYSKFGQTMSPNSVTKIAEVKRDLERDIEYKRLAKAGGPAVSKLIGEQVEPVKLPPIFNHAATIARSIMRRVEGKASEKTLNQLAADMKNPKEMARIMENATPKERSVLLKAMSNRSSGLVIGLPVTAATREN